MGRFAEGRNRGKGDALIHDGRRPTVIVAAQNETHLAACDDGVMHLCACPIAVGVALGIFRPNHVVLHVYLRKRPGIRQHAGEAAALTACADRYIGLALFVEEGHNAPAGHDLISRRMTERLAEEGGVIVVAIDDGHGAGQPAQYVCDQRQVTARLLLGGGVCQGVERVVQQVAGEDEQIRLQRNDALDG